MLFVLHHAWALLLSKRSKDTILANAYHFAAMQLLNKIFIMLIVSSLPPFFERKQLNTRNATNITWQKYKLFYSLHLLCEQSICCFFRHTPVLYCANLAFFLVFSNQGTTTQIVWILRFIYKMKCTSNKDMTV